MTIATYDSGTDAVYVGFSEAMSGRQVALDGARILDYATDGSFLGVELPLVTQLYQMNGRLMACERPSIRQGGW